MDSSASKSVQGFLSRLESDASLLLLREKSNWVIVTVCILFLVYAARIVSRNGKRSRSFATKVPVYGKAGDADFGDALTEGYLTHQDDLFTIPTAHHSMVIVPPRFLDEIKALPESVLSFQKQVSARFIGKYTGLGVNDTLVHSVKVDLTKNIVNILNELQEEVDYSVDLNIGDCPDWKPLKLYHSLSTLVALLSGRIFVGLPLSRNPFWIKATLSYTMEGFLGSDKLWKYPKLLHPIVHWFIPEIRNVKQYLAEGARFLRPIMEERRAMKANDPAFKPPQDMVQWIVDNSDGTLADDVYYVSKTQMLISVVAIHTTSMTVSIRPFTPSFRALTLPTHRWPKRYLICACTQSTFNPCAMKSRRPKRNLAARGRRPASQRYVRWTVSSRNLKDSARRVSVSARDRRALHSEADSLRDSDYESSV